MAGIGLCFVFVYGLTQGYDGEVGLRAAVHALIVAMALCCLEISLSFDNCVVDATVLARMEPCWQRRFLTWGMAFGVFGMRFAFPLLVIVVASGGNVTEVLLALTRDTSAYETVLHDAHPVIAAFGGTFLLMVFLGFLFDDTRSVHWIGWLERPLARLARIDGAALTGALVALLAVQAFSPQGLRLQLLLWGLGGALLYAVIDGAGQLLAHGQSRLAGKAGLAAFIYLETLDASFSFDSVLAAFAVTRSIVIITVGLAVGAFFVRSFAVLMVRRGTLSELVYLEHGAHYAIGVLALVMLFGTLPNVAVPDLAVALTGAVLIGLATLSSLLYRRRLSANQATEGTLSSTGGSTARGRQG